MNLRTFKFKEGTVIASVAEWLECNPKSGKIRATGKFTASLIGGTAPKIEPMPVKNGTKDERLFRSEKAAFAAAFELALDLGYHPMSNRKK